MKKSKIERIKLFMDGESKQNDDIVREYIVVTSGENITLDDTNVAEVCMFNGGACLITYMGDKKEQELYSASLDIPSGVGFVASRALCKVFFAESGYVSTSQVETQRFVSEHKSGKKVCQTTVVIEYYSPSSPKYAWELYDEKGILI